MKLHPKIFKTSLEALNYINKNFFKKDVNRIKETCYGNFRIVLK